MSGATIPARLRATRVIAVVNGIELFGHERGNIEVFKALRESGAEIRVGVNARKCGGAVAEELRRLGFETFQLPLGVQWSKAFIRKEPRLIAENPIRVALSSGALLRAVGSFSPTHLLIGSPLVYSYLCAATAVSRIPLVYRMGDCPPVDSPFNLVFWRAAMRRASKIVAISSFVRTEAIRNGVAPGKVQVIYNVAPSTASCLEPADVADRGGDVEREEERLIYLGAIAAHKGLIPLIEAIAELTTEFPRLRLDLHGGSAWDTEFRATIESLVDRLGLGARVALLGHTSDPAPVLRRAALHVAPSLWEEPLGNVVMEAKREGTPSIVFPSGGLPEMIRHEVDGYVCRAKSAGALANAIRWMLHDRNRLRRMGEAASEDYRHRFGVSRFRSEWEDVFAG